MAGTKHLSKIQSAIFPPWFLSRKVMRQVQRLLPSIYHKRLLAYFERYGCIRCNGKRVVYCSNGLCRSCTTLLIARLRRCDGMMAREYRDTMTAPSDQFLNKVISARTLLADLARLKNLKNTKRAGNKPPAKSIECRPVIRIRQDQPAAGTIAKMLL